MRSEIYKLNNDGSQSTIGVCTLENNRVTCAGNLKLVRLLDLGILDRETGGTIYPTDGLKFLSNLKYHFKSGYLLASDIMQ